MDQTLSSDQSIQNVFGSAFHSVTSQNSQLRRSHFLGATTVEFFPPKTAALEERLWAAVRRLEPLRPTEVAITYGAGGSTRDRTHSTLARILQETCLRPAAHLTCVGATKPQVDALLENYWAIGVRHIVALRGDPPGRFCRGFETTPGGYRNAADLVAGVRAVAPFEISVACHPGGRLQFISHSESDLDALQAKIDAGASRAITQFFFDNGAYFRFLDRVRSRGIDIPILPGLVPIYDFLRISNFAARAGVSVPDWLRHRFDGLERDPQTRRLSQPRHSPPNRYLILSIME